MHRLKSHFSCIGLAVQSTRRQPKKNWNFGKISRIWAASPANKLLKIWAILAHLGQKKAGARPAFSAEA
jgi:hypothetical protein